MSGKQKIFELYMALCIYLAFCKDHLTLNLCPRVVFLQDSLSQALAVPNNHHKNGNYGQDSLPEMT